MPMVSQTGTSRIREVNAWVLGPNDLQLTRNFKKFFLDLSLNFEEDFTIV